MDVVAASDVHLGWDESNTKDFREFLTETVPQLDVDALLLLGDIVEMWRRGIASVLIEHNGVFQDIEQLDSQDIEVVMVAGNHDWRLMQVNSSGDVVSPAPWQFTDEFYFSSGGKNFVGVHGHKADPATASDAENESLCMTNDETADNIVNAYESISPQIPRDTGVFDRNFLLPRTGFRTLVDLDRDGVRERRAPGITNRIEQLYNEHVIFGHTHIPKESEQSTNCGSWTGNVNNYVVVEGGETRIERF